MISYSECCYSSASCCVFADSEAVVSPSSLEKDSTQLVFLRFCCHDFSPVQLYMPFNLQDI